MEKKVYSVNEVLQQVPICRNTLVQAIKRGEIKSFRVGRRIFIPAEVLNQLLSGESQGTPAK